MKPSKTDRVVAAMSGIETVTIGHIRKSTGFKANEISGILASLERQERARQVDVDGATRNCWQLLRAEKRIRTATSNDSYYARRREEERSTADFAMKAGLDLQNIVLAMAGFRGAAELAAAHGSRTARI